MKKLSGWVLLVLIIVATFSSNAQPLNKWAYSRYLIPSDTLSKKRLQFVNIGSASCFGGMLFALKFAWYQNYEQTNFHFFNDNKEWLQMDKAGHTTWNYNGAVVITEVYQWAGMPRKKAIWYGAGIGFAMEMVVETLDGFSAKWGFSPGDFACDLTGAGLFVGQELLWKEQRIRLKYSAYQQSYSPINLQKRADNLYGPTFLHRATKDYNTQTYWATVNIKSFFPHASNRFPGWLGVAVGYSAENLFNGDDPFIQAPYKKYYDINGNDKNEKYFDKDGNDKTGGIRDATDYELTKLNHPRYRQILFSLDADLTKIKTKNRLLKMVFKTINVIKLPAPALEYNSLGQFKFHPFYF